MHIGFQTISFGITLKDQGRDMFMAISQMGYRGVEIAQNPQEFGSAKELYQILKESGLNLLGLAGGAVEDRVQFCRELIDAEDDAESKAAIKAANKSELTETKRIIRFDINNRCFPYIYVDSWEERWSQHLGEFNLALHNHMFTGVQTARETEALLRDNAELYFLPDTAHLTVAGEDVTEVLYRNYDRIVAIHLKDWASESGRSYQFYSQGFGVKFGKGDVGLEKIMKFLHRPYLRKDSGHGQEKTLPKFDGWIVVEQDKVDDPIGAAESSKKWIDRQLGLLKYLPAS